MKSFRFEPRVLVAKGRKRMRKENFAAYCSIIKSRKKRKLKKEMELGKSFQFRKSQLYPMTAPCFHERESRKSESIECTAYRD